VIFQIRNNRGQNEAISSLDIYCSCDRRSIGSQATEGSRCNITCCALLARQRESGEYVTQILRAKFAYDVRHVARVHHANVARTCLAQQVMLLLDPSVDLVYAIHKAESRLPSPRWNAHVFPLYIYLTLRVMAPLETAGRHLDIK
jgi:hypothetical protein